MSRNAAVKTLYTARFFETPSSSESTHPPPSKSQPSAYLEGLFQTHVALNQMEEVPDSRPNTPEKVDPERVEALRKQVVDAFNAAKHPASGKWGILANLLQTGTATGKYRYIGTTTAAVPPEPGPDGWLLADTEEEWLAWEEKRKEERRLEEARRREQQLLNERVEDWQRSVDIPPSDIDTDLGLDKMLADGVGPDRAHTRKDSSSRAGKSTAVPADGAKLPSKSVTTAARPLKPEPRSIAQLPEAPFHPPSFPSHLETSTPPAARYKPSPIELVPSSSPLDPPTKRRVNIPGPSRNDNTKPPSSPLKLSPADDVPSSSPLSSPPKNTRVYGRPRPSESPLKRARSSSPTPLTAVKKPRAPLLSSPGPASGSGPPTTPSPSKPGSKGPFTPSRNALPKLADLIAASAQKQKGKAKAKQKGKGKEKEPPVPIPRLMSESPPLHSPILAEDQEELNLDMSDEQRRLDLEAGIGVMEDDVINWDQTLERITTERVMDAVASPSKSLSSIDGSNSLDSQRSMDLPDFSHGAEFDPQGGSTQPMGRLEGGESLTTTERGGRGYGQPVDYSYPMRYESQMDVESNVQGVEQLLKTDVGAYAGGPWMGAGPDDDEEERWGGRGSGQIDSSP
ncbi:hypothetical protein DFH09DRAFT_1172800 [Mycena vulgaris]|nr:hypothetical protein DFH09DRAFT_1172800 [Mycena vulgaris]